MKYYLIAIVIISAGIVMAGTTQAQQKIKVPLGLQADAAFIPDDNPQTPAKIALGKNFFWDKHWSISGTVACVSCHQPNHGWSDPQSLSTNFAGKPTPRHAPTLVNRLFSDSQLWTGQRASLEEQALKDSNRTDEKVVEHLGAVSAYREEVRKVFGRDLEPVWI